AFLTVLAFGRAAAAEDGKDFQSFVAGLRPEAEAQGVSRASFDPAFKAVEADASVIAATKRQPEYGRPVGAYISSLVSEGRANEGKKRGAQFEETLAAIERKFGVNRFLLLAI